MVVERRSLRDAGIRRYVVTIIEHWIKNRDEVHELLRGNRTVFWRAKRTDTA